jgi:hypothetical protein
MFGLFRSTERNRKPSPRRFRPAVEGLEERALMSLTGAEFLVNTDLPGLQAGSVNATAGNGNSVVVWDHQTTPGNFDLRARIYGPTGAPLTGQLSLASTANNETVGGVAADPQGNFVVTWTEDVGQGRTVKAQRFTSAGASVGGVMTVATSGSVGPADWYPPQVAVSSTGGFVVTYVDVVAANGDTNVKARMFTASGALSKEITVSASADSRETHPSIAMDGQGRFAVAYRVGQIGEGRIELKHFAADGGLLRTVGVSAGPSDSAPSVGMNQAGNMVVAWHQIGGGAIQARRVSADGVVGNVFTIVTGNNAAFPHVALQPTREDFIVGYTALTLSPTNEADFVVRVAEVNSADRVTSDLTVARTTTPSVPAVLGGVSISSTGRYLVTYTATSRDSDGGIHGWYGIEVQVSLSPGIARPGQIPIPSGLVPVVTRPTYPPLI